MRRWRSLVAMAGVLGLVGFWGTRAASADSDVVRLRADLKGTQELQLADADGTGKAKVDIDVEAGEVCFDVKFRNAGTANRGHIHRGDAATNGPIVVPFFDLHTADTVSDPRHDELESTRGLDGCVEADPALLEEIVANPDGFYVNLHNARFPAGVMRCQLEA